MKCLKCGKKITSSRCSCGFDCLKNSFLSITSVDTYMSNFENGKLREVGTVTLSDGSVYTGELLDGIPNGSGTLNFPDGGIYKGEFLDGQRQGKGIYTYPDGNEYEGDWASNVKHGEGIVRYINGNVYRGSLQNGDLHGEGVFTYSKGGKYEGAWKFGLKSGHGKETSANGTIYEGDFLNGKRHGHGVARFASGFIFVGTWVDGDAAKGTISFADGSKYEGELKDGKYHGKGILTKANGTKYEGEWNNGVLVQQGKTVGTPAPPALPSAPSHTQGGDSIPKYIKQIRNIVKTNFDTIKGSKEKISQNSQVSVLVPPKMSGAMFRLLEPTILEEYQVRVGTRVSEHLGSTLVAEYDKVSTPDQAVLFLEKHLPNYRALIHDCGREMMNELEQHWSYYSMEFNLQFLLPVEDVFEITGRGTIAVGRVEVGNISVGDPVEVILSDGGRLPSSVTCIDMYRKVQSQAQVGDNVGIGLKGVTKSAILNAQAIVNVGAEPLHTSFTARIHLHTKEKGGTGKPIFNHYYPHYEFSTSSSRGMTTFKNNSLEMLTPGHDTEVEVVLDKPCVIYSGMHFGIHEGGKNYVAKGEIIAIND